MNGRARIFLGMAIFTLSSASEDYSAPTSSSQTVIEDEDPINDDVKQIYFKEKEDEAQASDAAMLFHIPGLTISESAGLSAAEINYRGLANQRLSVDLEGLPLNMPLNGFFDANSLFLFAAEHLTADAQALTIHLPSIDRPLAKAIVGFGSLNTVKIGARAASPLGRHSSIFTAMQLRSSEGNFSFASPDLAKNNPSHFFVRQNNDQHRLQGVAKYRFATSFNKAEILLALQGHEGGMPGFAFSLTPHLRSKAFFAGLKASYLHKIENHEMGVTFAHTFYDYKTSDDLSNSHNENIQARHHEITILFKRRGNPSWLQLNFEPKFIVESMDQLHKTRMGGGIVISRNRRYQVKLRPTIQTMTSLIVFDGGGLIRNNNVALTIEPSDFLSITTRLKYLSRLPTFMELYASNQFFSGNDNLKNEGIWDIELGHSFRFLPYGIIRLNGSVGFINDIIVYVPFLIGKYRPINTGSASRHGIDLSVVVEPLTWLSLKTHHSFLHSKIKATNAPLPQAPRFSGLMQMTFKPTDFLKINLQSRYQSASAANIYGTLRTKPFIVVDAMMAAQLSEHLGLSLSINNVLNNKSMQQSYELPLPGLHIFGQVEIKNI